MIFKKQKLRLALGFLWGGLACYLTACMALYVWQDKLIFPSYYVFMSSVGERISISTDQGATQVLVRENNAECDLLYFGGNAEAVDGSLAALNEAFNCNLLLMTYRGYGASEGTPSQQHLFSDARLLYQLRQKAHPKHHFIIVGRSLGASVATYLASIEPVRQLVLVTPFDSLRHLVQQKFPWVPVGWLLKHPFESDQYARLITAPVHIIMAEADEIIPTQNTLNLMASFVLTRPRLTSLSQVGHNNVDDHRDYLLELGRLL